MKVFCSLLSLFLFAVSAFSQDCNGTYEGGLALLKKRTEASVKEAVRKFESAKRCYKVNRDQQGVQNCDEQITACKQILNYFTQQTAKVTAEESYEFPEAGGEQIIPVKTKRSWSFSGVHDWCTATKEKDGLKIVVNPNRTTVRRSQTITLKWSGRKQLVKIVLGSIPISFPGIPQPVKLGLAGGPLVVAILISRFGYHYKLITYTTQSANLMLREIGITLFLACVGISAGDGFVDTIVNNGGFAWIGYGFIITFVPLMIIGCIGRYFCKVNYFTLMGLIAGSTTDPPALAYSNATAGNDAPSVGYATVYPLTMFLRVLTAQLLILFFA